MGIHCKTQGTQNWDVYQPRGVDGEGDRFKREGTYIYLWLIHGDIWQKQTQFSKAIILQLKNEWKLLTCVHLFVTLQTIQSMEFFRPEYSFWIQNSLSGYWSIPSPVDLYQLRDWTQVSHVAGGFFTSWATREALIKK